MRLKGIRRSKNVEMRGGGRRLTGAKGGLGVAGLLAVLAIGYFTGIDVSPLIQGGSVQQEQSSGGAADSAAADFSAKVLTTTEQVWTNVFEEQLGRSYTPRHW